MPAMRRKTVAFQPVIMFNDRTPTDDLAVRQLYTLHEEVRRTMDTERSRKQTIGISEIGNPCKKCVARKLSMLYVKIPDPSWKAQVGTFIHSGLEDHWAKRAYPWMYELAEDTDGDGNLLRDNQGNAMWKWQVRPELVATDEQPLYHLERRVYPFQHKSLDLNGSSDMFVQGASFGIVGDWKTQGPRKLAITAKGDIGDTYLVQAMTYGLGYEQLGYLVTHVVVYALPRDGELDEARPVLMRYDRQIALDALAFLAQLIDAAEIIGWEAVIDSQPTTGACFDCRPYEQAESNSMIESLVG